MAGRGDVRVVVRFRPQQDRELAKGGVPICQFEPSGKVNVTLHGNALMYSLFSFLCLSCFRCYILHPYLVN